VVEAVEVQEHVLHVVLHQSTMIVIMHDLCAGCRALEATKNDWARGH
jgi:hypothetical protein